MSDKPKLELVPHATFPSILVDKISGLEFTDYVRDVPAEYVGFLCRKCGHILCMSRAKRIGLIETPDGPQLKFLMSLPRLEREFRLNFNLLSPSQKAEIGNFDKCLPLMIEAWQALKDSPQLSRAGGRVVIEFSSEVEI